MTRHFEEATGKEVIEPIALTLPADSFRDRVYMDWLLANKDGESSLLDDYQDLIHTTFTKVTKGGKVNGLDVILSKAEFNQIGDQDNYIDAQLKSNDTAVDEKLRAL